MEIIKTKIDIIDKIKEDLLSICSYGMFILSFERITIIIQGVKNTIITINLLFSTPYLNNMGKIIDIYKIPTAQSTVDSNSIFPISVEPMSKLSIMFRRKAAVKKIMLIIYLLITMSSLERGMDKAYLSHLAFSS